MKGNNDHLKSHSRSYMDRPVDAINIRQRFLIVCEGAKTEPQYFRRFRVPGLVVEVKGLGMNTISLVREAINLRAKSDYDQIWCVFDKDDFSIDQFENAIELARKKRLKVAYSNQAFELWYVLHFEYLHSAIDRTGYMRKLDNYLNTEYKKNDPNIYQYLKCNIQVAITNAQRLMAEYHDHQPGRNDPSTTVHELVIALLEQEKPLS